MAVKTACIDTEGWNYASVSLSISWHFSPWLSSGKCTVRSHEAGRPNYHQHSSSV